MARAASKPFSLSNFPQKPLFFAIFMYPLYGHPRYFKFKQKYQQYGPCFQTMFPFLMTALVHQFFFLNLLFTWEQKNILILPRQFWQISFHLVCSNLVQLNTSDIFCHYCFDETLRKTITLSLVFWWFKVTREVDTFDF